MADFMNSNSASGKSIPRSSTLSPSASAAPWLALARRFRARVNLAWWLQSWLTWWMGILLVGAVFVLLQRVNILSLPTSVLLYGIFAIILLAALHCCLRAREHWINEPTALQHLEAKQNLHNALSTAAAGVGEWPRYGRDTHELPLTWQWKRILPSLFIPLALLGAALLLPQLENTDLTSNSSRPAAWEQIESVLLNESLQQLADPERVHEMQEKMDNLSKRPPGEWYELQSLETGDRVASLLNSGLEQTERNLAKAAQVMNRLQEGQNAQNQPLSDAQREELARQLEQNFLNLQNQPLGISEEMREHLMQMSPQALQAMNPQQAQEMMEQLREWSEQAGNLSEQMGQQGGEKPLWQQLLEQEQQGGSQGEGEGQGGEHQPCPNCQAQGMNAQGGVCPHCQGTGNCPQGGGINRGPGSAPLTLKPDESLLDPNLSGGLQGDAQALQPGEQIGESLSVREVERTQMGIRAGGEAQQEGSGGDRVWRQQLTPNEQNLLENYFE